MEIFRPENFEKYPHAKCLKNGIPVYICPVWGLNEGIYLPDRIGLSDL